ncbi:MAG: hypothetical protein M3O91_05500 [Chloroflexota bacterium]|nr:hypothetical protein [Chloroflexota bacterium]
MIAAVAVLGLPVFGIPVTHDDDADRAIRAAFALRDRVARLNAGGRFQVEFRIGGIPVPW